MIVFIIGRPPPQHTIFPHSLGFFHRLRFTPSHLKVRIWFANHPNISTLTVCEPSLLKSHASCRQMDYNYFHVQGQSLSAAPEYQVPPNLQPALPHLPLRAVVTIPPDLRFRIQTLTNTSKTINRFSDPALANACRHAADERLGEVEGVINRVNQQLVQQFDADSYNCLKLLLEELFRLCGEVWGEPMQTQYRQRYGYLIGS
jgi:hypothetical protein